jgi:hypothetical protein
MTSTGPAGLIVTFAEAFGTQPAATMPGERTMSNVTGVCAEAGLAAMPPSAAASAATRLHCRNLLLARNFSAARAGCCSFAVFIFMLLLSIDAFVDAPWICMAMCRMSEAQEWSQYSRRDCAAFDGYRRRACKPCLETHENFDGKPQAMAACRSVRWQEDNDICEQM